MPPKARKSGNPESASRPETAERVPKYNVDVFQLNPSSSVTSSGSNPGAHNALRGGKLLVYNIHVFTETLRKMVASIKAENQAIASQSTSQSTNTEDLECLECIEKEVLPFLSTFVRERCRTGPEIRSKPAKRTPAKRTGKRQTAKKSLVDTNVTPSSKAGLLALPTLPREAANALHEASKPFAGTLSQSQYDAQGRGGSSATIPPMASLSQTPISAQSMPQSINYGVSTLASTPQFVQGSSTQVEPYGAGSPFAPWPSSLPSTISYNPRSAITEGLSIDDLISSTITNLDDLPAVDPDSISLLTAWLNDPENGPTTMANTWGNTSYTQGLSATVIPPVLPSHTPQHFHQDTSLPHTPDPQSYLPQPHTLETYISHTYTPNPPTPQPHSPYTPHPHTPHPHTPHPQTPHPHTPHPQTPHPHTPLQTPQSHTPQPYNLQALLNPQRPQPSNPAFDLSDVRGPAPAFPLPQIPVPLIGTLGQVGGIRSPGPFLQGGAQSSHLTAGAHVHGLSNVGGEPSPIETGQSATPYPPIPSSNFLTVPAPTYGHRRTISQPTSTYTSPGAVSYVSSPFYHPAGSSKATTPEPESATSKKRKRDDGDGDGVEKKRKRDDGDEDGGVEGERRSERIASTTQQASDDDVVVPISSHVDAQVKGAGENTTGQ